MLITYQYILFCWIRPTIWWRIIYVSYTNVWIKVISLLFESLSNTLRLCDICCAYSPLWILCGLCRCWLKKLNISFGEQHWGIMVQSFIVFSKICWMARDILLTIYRYLWKCGLYIMFTRTLHLNVIAQNIHFYDGHKSHLVSNSIT